MGREIRITIDDDEVFERLKRRKQELDLSWEEALRRGLERGRESSTGWRAEYPRHPRQPPQPPHSRDRERARSEHPSPFDPDFGDRLRREIESSVRESMDTVEESMDAVRAGLGVEIDRLEDAEDATLSFPFLEDDRARVPLRVNLQTSADGLDVDVVAVRRGKDTATSNRFAADQRAQVNRRLAEGASARLELQNGSEAYDVVPTLSWGRADDGTPTVTDVECDVRFE
ncbi:hypothetical protein [Haladaptatus halobius]|uniref:hypothetical protein n=1 Tax=Haladaptatus halobius TaxID=2884875 RepID=UPI001D0BCCDB|nr:hypothetical protein [Haladaptatus halobius]